MKSTLQSLDLPKKKKQKQKLPFDFIEIRTPRQLFNSNESEGNRRCIGVRRLSRHFHRYLYLLEPATA